MRHDPDEQTAAIRGLRNGILISSVFWAIAIIVIIWRSSIGIASAQSPPSGVTVYTKAEVDLLLAPIRADIAALKQQATATPPPATLTPTVAPTPSPTATVKPKPRPRGLSYTTGWDVTAGQTADARNKGASIIKISASFPHRKTSDLSAAELSRLQASLNTVRAAGLSAVVRFSYWYHWDGTDQTKIDADPFWAHRHVDQLATVINANADVMLAVEAGMVGKWGEWHYHGVPSQFHTYGERCLCQSTTGPRANLVRKLLDTYQVPVAFRYPRDIRWMWGFLTPAQFARVAMHNDAVLTEPGEWGTWESQSDRDWLGANFLDTPRIVGGEFAESTDYNDQDLTDALFDLAWRQYSYHSHDSGNQPGGILERLNRLGLWDDLVRGVSDGW